MKGYFDFFMTLNTPSGKTGRISHNTVSEWLNKHSLKIKYDYGNHAWNVVSEVSAEQWEDFHTNYTH